MQNLKHSILLGIFIVLPSRFTEAHFTLVQPPSCWTIDDGGKGSPPCGEGTPSNIVTKVQGGHPITIKLVEFVVHPGHYRVALAVNSRAELPPDPDVIADASGLSLGASIQNPPKIPVLADGLFVHTSVPDNGVWQADIMLPNINCARCTLQVIEFMADHGPNVGGGYFYHHCADLQITADPNAPPPDPAWIRMAMAPTVASLKPGASRQFTVTVAGTDNTAVSWAATGGTISNAGLYTAPSSPGYFTVSATSAAASSRSVSAGVSVSGQDQRLYFAQFANGTQSGASTATEITLQPLVSGATALATVEINDDAGEPLSVNLNGGVAAGRADVLIPANGAVTLRTNGLGPLKTGSLIVSSDVKLMGLILFDGSIGLSGGADSKPLRKFSAPVRMGSGIYTGIALMGLGQNQTVQLELRTQQGNLVAGASLPLGSKAHLARFINQFAWDSAVDFSQFSGTLTTRGTSDMAATAILITPTGSAWLPVEEISP